jgi:hypothetical protein
MNKKFIQVITHIRIKNDPWIKIDSLILKGDNELFKTKDFKKAYIQHFYDDILKLNENVNVEVISICDMSKLYE